MGEVARCVVVDAHSTTRDGVCAAIERDVQVVGEAASRAEATEVVADQRPELVVSGLTLPDARGVEIVEAVLEAHPPCRILVLSARSSPMLVRRLFASGAAGYVRKDTARGMLSIAVQTVLGGQRFVDPRTAPDLLHPGATAISDREQQILELIGRGMSNDQIAAELFVSVETVKSHVSSIMRKLGAGSRTDAVARAFRQALLH